MPARAGLWAIVAILASAACSGERPAAIVDKTPPESAAGQAAPAAVDATSAALAPAKPTASVTFADNDEGQGVYGAVALASNGSQLVGFISFNEADRAAAEAAARRGCGKQARQAGGSHIEGGCKAELYFHNACGAVAQGGDGAYGTGWSDRSWRTACQWAESVCKDYGGADCEGVVYACAPGGLRGTCDGSIQIVDGVTHLH